MNKQQKILVGGGAVVSVVFLAAAILAVTKSFLNFYQALYFSATFLIPLAIIAVGISGGVYLWQKLSGSKKAADNYFGLLSWPVTIIAALLLLGVAAEYFSPNSISPRVPNSIIPAASLIALLVMVVGAISYLRFKYISWRARKNADKGPGKITEKTRSRLGYLFWQGLFVLILLAAIGGIVQFLTTCGGHSTCSQDRGVNVHTPLMETATTSTSSTNSANQ